MYSSLEKIDFVVQEPTGAVAVQTDHREAGEIEEDWDISVLFAACRARSALLSGHATRVRFAFANEPPARMVALIQQLGGAVERMAGGETTPEAPDAAAADRAVEEAFLRVGASALSGHGLTADLAGLQRLETELLAQGTGGPEGDDAITHWTHVLQLGGAAAVVMKSLYSGGISAEADVSGCVPFRWSIDGSLLNLFGRAVSFLDDDPGIPPSKLITMQGESSSPDGDVMFNFRPSDWPGVGMALTLPLLPTLAGLPGHDLPIVALVMDRPTSTATLPKSTPDEAVEALRQAALTNLRKLDVEIQEIAAGDAPLLVVHGHYYAAERLLDAEFMRELHTRLGGAILLAGVPAKGMLMLQSGVAGPERSAAFMNVIRGQYDRAEPSDRLSTAVLLVQDGLIVGVAQLGESAPQLAPPKKKGFWARLFGGQDH